MTRYIVAAIYVATLACGTSPVDRGSVSRDSSGITLVQHGPDLPSSVEHWSVDTTEFIAIATLQGKDSPQFSSIVHAGLSPRGEFVVGDAVTNDIHMFDANGQLIQRIGRKGEGPGEFRWLRWFSIDKSGAITSYDGTLRRLTRFASNGAVEEIISLALHSDLSVGTIIGRFADGSTLLRRPIGLPDDPSEAPTGLVRDTIGLYLIKPDGSDAKLIGKFLGPEIIRAVGQGVSQKPAPFGLNVVIAVGDSAFYVSTQENYQYQIYDYQGQLKRVVRRLIPRPLVDEESRTRWIREADAQLDRALAGGPLPPFLLEMNSYRTIPSYFPSHGMMLLDRIGNLWVQDYLPFPDDHTRTTWTIFNPEGGIVARAELPALQITAISEDQVIGIWRDDDDVPHVRVYRLLKKA